MHWFDYSVIKYSPNPKRGEVINIGIVVFRSSGVDVRLLNNPSKFRMFDNGSTLDDISALEASILQLCSFAETTDEQFNLLKSYTGGIYASSKSSFSITDISKYEPKVSQLFAELIKPYANRGVATSHSRLYTKLKQRFKVMNLLASDEADIYNHKIVPSYPLGSNSGLYADFMLKNGKFHMTEVIDFNVNDTQAKFKETTLKMMSFVEARKNISADIGAYLVFSAKSDKESEIVQHLNLATDYSDRLFNLDSADDSRAYFNLLSDLVGGAAIN